MDERLRTHQDVSPEGTTRERVARSILVNGASTAAALAERLQLTPAAVRRHLDQLLDEGMIESREARSLAVRGRGRPARAFALTDLGRDSFVQQYDDLAAEALRFLSETAGEDAVRAFARRRVSFIEDRFGDVAADNPDLEPAEALAVLFTDEGYAASVRSGPVGEQLCQQHCPVAHVAHEFPQLCEAETEAISRVLGKHVQRLATIAHGDGVCTTCIPTAGPTGFGMVPEEVAQQPSRRALAGVVPEEGAQRPSRRARSSTTDTDTADDNRKVAR